MKSEKNINNIPETAKAIKKIMQLLMWHFSISSMYSHMLKFSIFILFIIFDFVFILINNINIYDINERIYIPINTEKIFTNQQDMEIKANPLQFGGSYNEPV